MRLLTCLLRWSMTLGSALVPASAFQQGSPMNVDALLQPNLASPDLYIKSPALADDIKSALSVIQSVETLPSCNRMAAASLIHECATLDSPIRHHEEQLGPDSVLDSSKQLYAARLAVCELHDAKVSVPNACRSFLPSKKGVKTRLLRWRLSGDEVVPGEDSFPTYEALTSQHLDRCLAALHQEGSGQGWTSFSNNKKHAVAMCHAVRGDVEKDSHIHLFKVLANSTVGITEALGRSTQEWNDLVAAFQMLKSNMQQFHVELHRGDVEKQNEVMSLWAEVKAQIRGDLQHVTDEVQRIRDQLSDANSDAAGARTRIDDLAVQSTNAISAASEQVGALRSAMALVQELLQHSVTTAILNATQDIQHTTELATANVHMVEHLYSQSERAVQIVASIEAAASLMQSDFVRMHAEAVRSHEELQAINNRTIEQAERTNESIMRLTKVVSNMTTIFQAGYSMIVPYLQDTFWMGVFVLCSFSSWRLITGDIISAASLSMGSGLVLAFVVRLQDILNGSSDAWLRGYGGLLGVVTAAWTGPALYQRCHNILFPKARPLTSHTLPTNEQQPYFHHPINDPKRFHLRRDSAVGG